MTPTGPLMEGLMQDCVGWDPCSAPAARLSRDFTMVASPRVVCCNKQLLSTDLVNSSFRGEIWEDI